MVQISVIIPCYNTEWSYFKQCIKSILLQTFQSFEILIVDDGSNQDFANKIDKSFGHNEHIQIFHQQNQGVSAARNFGVSQAKGEAICFVDADDYVSPVMLEILWNRMAEHQADIVTSYIKRVYNSEYLFDNDMNKAYRIIRNDEGRFMRSVILKGFNCKEEKLGYISGGPCALLIRRELAKTIKFPDGIPYMEDVIWNYQVFSSATKTVLVFATTYAYRQNPASATHEWKLSVIAKREQSLQVLGKLIDLSTSDQSWFALRVLSSYCIICKCCCRTDELKHIGQRISTAKNVLHQDPLWYVFSDASLTKDWDRKYKILRILATTGALPVAYYVQAIIQRIRYREVE